MRVLLVGGFGAIGGVLSDRLLGNGHEVFCMGRGDALFTLFVLTKKPLSMTAIGFAANLLMRRIYTNL